MRTITLDIETITPTWKEGVYGWNKDRFPPVPFHVPVVVRWLTYGVRIKEGGYRADRDKEQVGLQLLAHEIQDCDRLVTFNGRGFDMPVLGTRAMVHGVNWSWWEKWRHRYPNYKNPLRHYDLCDQLSDYGAAPRPSLDHVCKALGFGGKDGIDGSMVSEVWAAGDHDAIDAYCRWDVFDTWLVYLHFLRSYQGRDVSPAIEATVAYIEDDDTLAKHYPDGLWI
jgi:predicted PolB exonuclease-like 3'-5' exonuclease